MAPNTPEEMPTPPPPLDGELRFDEPTRNARADDFGHIVHKIPEGVLLSGSADDVAKTIQWIAPRGGKFAPRRRHVDAPAHRARRGRQGGRRGWRVVKRRAPRDVGAGQDAARAHRLPRAVGRRHPHRRRCRWHDHYLNRFAPFEAMLRANEQWFFPHPWLITFIGDSQVESVVNAELDALNPAMDLGPFGQVALVPIRRSAISSPLLRMPVDDLCYAFNLVRIPATNDTDGAKRLVGANKATYGRVTATGSTVYPVSALPMSKGEWRDHFGSAFGQLDAAKQQYDPDEILTPGYEIF
jgi:FAD/FMN-containing dehydrogenase